MAIIRSLGESGIPIVALYYDKNDMAYVSKYVKEKHFIPHPEQETEKFIHFLEMLAKVHADGVLIPTDDASLVAVSKNKELLIKHYKVAATEWDITEKFISKQYTYKIAELNGIPIPRTLFPRDAVEVEKYAENSFYPCLIKPFQSHLFYDYFKVKMFKVFNSRELIQAYEKTRVSRLDVMIQEYIPGDDDKGVNYNSYFWDNEARVEFTAEKVRLSPPDIGVPCVVKSKDIPEVKESGRKILKALKFYGYSCTEFKKDERDGIYKLLEVNGRHNRSGLLAVKCGINFPLIHYNHIANDYLPEALPFKKEVYWIDVINELFVCMHYLFRKKQPLLKFIEPYFKEHIFANLDIYDLKPFLKRIMTLIASVIKKVIRI